MDRIDSGFAGSHHSKIASEGPVPLHRSNTTSPRQQRSKKPALGPSSSYTTQITTMENRRPVSEQRSRPLRQQSTTSSENSTNRSKSRGGHGSKPSSRRTSCTIVDPSRPARHYRIKSFQTPSVALTQDVDDVLALHFRSCSIFSNPSYQSNSGLPSPALSSHADASGFPSTATRFSIDSLRVVEETAVAADAHPHRRSAETTLSTSSSCSSASHANEKTNTPMHWTSPCTRQREYERIDKANSGLRGFWRRMTPRCVSGPHEKFYDQNASDTGSVRRYRICNDDDDAEDQDDIRRVKELQRPRTSPVPRPGSRPGIKKRWTCF
jgi:hypothetical protein